MGMKIVDIIQSLTDMKSVVGVNQLTINEAIETMTKYKKIDSIWDNWYLDMQVKSELAMTELGDVLKDGNI